MSFGLCEFRAIVLHHLLHDEEASEEGNGDRLSTGVARGEQTDLGMQVDGS
jgi:hypothetical protein